MTRSGWSFLAQASPNHRTWSGLPACGFLLYHPRSQLKAGHDDRNEDEMYVFMDILQLMKYW